MVNYSGLFWQRWLINHKTIIGALLTKSRGQSPAESTPYEKYTDKMYGAVLRLNTPENCFYVSFDKPCQLSLTLFRR